MVILTTIQLKDYSSVNKLNAWFMDLALKGKILDSAAQLTLYRNALPEYLLRKISMSCPLPTNIEEWMTRAKEINHSYHLTEQILANHKGRKAKTLKTRKNVKTVNVEDNLLDINKLSVKERQELQDKGLCFRYRKLGHISRDCPSKPKKPGKPVQDKAVEIKGLIDTGADAVIVNKKIVDKYNLPTGRLPETLTFRNTNNSVNSMETITYQVEGTFNLHGKKLPTYWYVADIRRDDVLFGMPWICKYNPNIDWESGCITFQLDIIKKQQQIYKYQCEHNPPEGMLWNFPVKPLNQDLVVLFVRAIPDEDDADPDSERLTFNPLRAIELWYRKKKIQKINKSTKIAIAAKKDQKEKTLDEILPDFVKDYRQIFEKKAGSRFPPSRPWDHATEFKKDFNHHTKGTRQFIAENLKKGYIQKSKSPLASPFFFVTKKDGSLRPVQDYRALNEGTIKNAYPLPLISDIIDRLKGATIFTKLDVRAGYNNVRIKEGDEWKAAFITPSGLFEPTVMFFGLCNAPATFQNMMNDLFRDMLQEGWMVIYMDDILIFSDNVEDHHERTRRALHWLKDSDLFLKAEKCEFDRQEVEFLGSIIRPGVVAMDPVKLKAIIEWEPPKTVKQVQAFLGFGNFYRRFIRDYSKIVRPLTELTKKDQPFLWTPECQKAFDTLKKWFTEEPILQIPDPEKPFQIECNASKVATDAALRQQGEDGLWHPCAYLSKSFTPAERNYQIYDRELLAIVRALEAWQHFLQGSPHPTEILSDHKNLTYFHTAQKLNRRQARWHLFLSEFNIGMTGGENDNKDVVLLGPELFAKAVNIELKEHIRDSKLRDNSVVEYITLKGKATKRPEFGKPEDWSDDDGILLYKNRVYVPPDNQLYRDIVKMHHDAPIMGHPGVQKTYDLVKREYMWPGMRKFIVQYVKGCAACQTSKVNTHPIKPGFIPIQHSGDTRPFRTITMDYITDLPESDGFNAVQVAVDHDVSKAAEHGPDYVRPPPIPTPESTEGAEWEVEAILSHRTRGTQKQYLVAWKGATSPVPPNFIRERRTVFYNHLPRHTVSANDEGTLADRIGWVIVHPDLYSHVEARISHLPEVKDLIDVYRSLTRAAPSYGVLVNYNKRTSAPKSEKKKVDRVANEAYQAVIQGAEKVLSMLANPQIAGALSDLMPLRNQHGTHNWGHIFWPQRLDDYPEPIEVDEDEDADVATPDPEEEAVKWGQTSEESTPSLVSSHSDSPYSEVESFDLLPELEHLELSTVDEVDELSEEEFHKALKVAVRAPSPPPPPSSTLTKNDEEPRGRCGFFRGTGEDRLGYVNSNGDIFVVPNNPFGISVTRIMVAYHLRWPEASVRTTMAASLLIDDVIARRGNFPAFKIEAERTPTTYRQAIGMSAAESAQWDCIRAVGNESDLVQISLDVFRPEVVERNQNIIVHA
ncbi:hypothetical protein ONZ51_g12371 [Trametes cubensis]|uniref:RNA-directed DNA polymerase n=1 Tax=Trametes cubensis TaxID=1111947 RepID=A0AAD7TGA6_9APHY|nr:hypothetical protein ONZ51_g12371 [Trametes cubensis]